MRKLPCGRILHRSVHEGRPWIKKVVLMNGNGQVIMTKIKFVDPDTCQKIKGGIFVRGLWENDGALGCIRESVQ